MEQIELGCINHCEYVVTGLNADVDGDYTIKSKFNGQQKVIEIPLLIGDEIQFKGLNEYYIHHFTITPPVGSAIDSSQSYKIEIKPKI